MMCENAAGRRCVIKEKGLSDSESSEIKKGVGASLTIIIRVRHQPE
jgi:hypothetical protein